MKKLITSIIFLITLNFCFGQATIKTGRVNGDGNFETDRTSFLANDFQWSISDTLITCGILQGDSIVENLAWNVRETIYGESADRFLVTTFTGKDFILDFEKGGKSVIILNESTLSYSIMEGEGVIY